MGFKDIADLDCETTFALGGVDKKSGKKNPISVQGHYIGSKQVKSPKSKTGFAALHVFQTPKGNVGVWGKTNLDQKMRAVTPGDLCLVTFTGMVETKNNPMYKYRVQVDEGQRIEVAAPSEESGEEEAQADAPETAGSYADDGEEEPGYEEEEAAQDEVAVAPARPPARPASAPSAASQAKVQALLNSRPKR